MSAPRKTRRRMLGGSLMPAGWAGCIAVYETYLRDASCESADPRASASGAIGRAANHEAQAHELRRRAVHLAGQESPAGGTAIEAAFRAARARYML